MINWHRNTQPRVHSSSLPTIVTQTFSTRRHVIRREAGRHGSSGSSAGASRQRRAMQESERAVCWG